MLNSHLHRLDIEGPVYFEPYCDFCSALLVSQYVPPVLQVYVYVGI